MIEVRIDSEVCDLAEGYSLPHEAFTLAGEALSSVGKQRGRSLTVEIPSSPHNDRIMHYATDPATGEPFNLATHTGEVRVDGVTLLRGAAMLDRIECKGRTATYCVKITDSADHWAERASRTPLQQTSIDYAATLGAEAIEQSWGEGEVVRLLPVRYDDYREPYDSTSLYPPQRAMTVADYHPFIALGPLIEAIFAESGYTVESRFMQSEEFRKLHISGAYPRSGRSISELTASSGFVAGRTSSPTAEADYMGRVWLTPLVLTNSLGNFVETTEGDGLYNNGAVLSITQDGVKYRPKVEVTTGFEIFLKYVTECRMASSRLMEGFDSLYVGEGCDLHFPLPNPYKDRRNAPSAGVTYRCVVFDYVAGTTLRLLCHTASGQSVVATFSDSTALVTMPTSIANAHCTLQILDGTSYADYTGDWALYDGYVTTSTEVEVEVTLQTPPEKLSPNAAKDFSQMYLHGAVSGQRVTLSEHCTLRPLFSSSPAEGSAIAFEDVAAVDYTQMELLEAVQQMFNLRIATDTAARRVYIEPYDDFYSGAEVDWSHRADLSGSIVAREQAIDVASERVLAYRAEGDGAVARYNQQAEQRFGEWHYTTPSAAAKADSTTVRNPLFCPTLSMVGVHQSAPSASVMQVGDRDSDEVGSVTARIVRYEGMRPLPEGERWGYPTFGDEYPFAAFHAAGEFTLCFEDRDGAEGLHRYYDRQWQSEAVRRTLTLDLRLLPHELVATADYGSDEGSARGRYLLNLTGQRAVYRLDEVEQYDAATGVARCRMVRTDDEKNN